MASIYFSKTKCYNICLRKFSSKTSDIHTFAHHTTVKWLRVRVAESGVAKSKVAESRVAKWLPVE